MFDDKLMDLGEGEALAEDLLEMVQQELRCQHPRLARLSIALGCLEAALTPKDQSKLFWPDLKAVVKEQEAVFESFVVSMDANIRALPQLSTRAKVKMVADAVWSRLTAATANDVPHIQHVFSFVNILRPPPGAGKKRRLLDCAGTTTTVLAACQLLGLLHGHEDLLQCRLQVSEDHCWINTSCSGGQPGTVEVTTDTAKKRGLAVTPDAWRSWLYNGGKAVCCSPHIAVTALVASMNPGIDKKTDSELLQTLQYRLLRLIRATMPDAMYPAAVNTLADLMEVAQQERLDAAAEAADPAAMAALLAPDDPPTRMLAASPKALFLEALRASTEAAAQALQPDGLPRLPAGFHWYPSSYLFGFSARRAAFLFALASAEVAAPATAQGPSGSWTEMALDAALEAVAYVGAGQPAPGCRGGGAVLQRYRYTRLDEQLLKDVGDVMEAALKLCQHCTKVGGAAVSSGRLLVPVLELLDGVGCLFAGRAKPAGILDHAIKAAKCFPCEARAAAAAEAQICSQMMARSRKLWRECKPALKAACEAAELDDSPQQEPCASTQDSHPAKKLRPSFEP